jgi:hypothetical protein
VSSLSVANMSEEEIDTLFEVLDSDGSGVVTRQKLTDLLASLAPENVRLAYAEAPPSSQPHYLFPVWDSPCQAPDIGLKTSGLLTVGPVRRLNVFPTLVPSSSPALREQERWRQAALPAACTVGRVP